MCHTHTSSRLWRKDSKIQKINGSIAFSMDSFAFEWFGLEWIHFTAHFVSLYVNLNQDTMAYIRQHPLLNHRPTISTIVKYGRRLSPPPPPHTHTASSSPSMDHTFVFPILKLEENRTGGLDRWALHLFFSLFPRPSVKTLWWLRDWIHGSVIEGMTKWDFPYIYIFLLFWCWEGGGGGGSVREELFNSKRE